MTNKQYCLDNLTMIVMFCWQKKKDKQIKQERTDKIKTPQCKNKTTLTLETKY